MLKALPDTPERAQQELTLQIALGGPLMATKGWALRKWKGPTPGRANCAEQVGETPQLFPVLVGLWGFYSLRAELQTARELAEQLLSLAQRIQDPALLLEAYHAAGRHLILYRRVGRCPTRWSRGLPSTIPNSTAPMPFSMRMTPGCAASPMHALALWLLGYPDQALKRMHEALHLAQELSHPVSLALALLLCCLVPPIPPGGASRPRAGRGM